MPAAVDPWLLDSAGNPDVFASNINWGANAADLVDPDLPPAIDPHPVLQPEIVQNTRPAEPDPVVTPDPPPAPVEPETPETMELPDGTSLTLEKEKGQWKGSVVGGTGNPQIYWGKTKNELVFEILKAQANATKKIRDLNKQVKLGGQAPKQVISTPTPASRELTADEIFEIKTQLDSNSDLALSTWFQKKTGLSVDQLVTMAQEGKQAALELRAESINKKFISDNPDYYGDPDFENFGALVKWVSKYKAGKIVQPGEENQTFWNLVSTGQWNVENIEEAFEDLSADNALIKAPKPPKAPPVPVSEPEPAPPANPRIVSSTVRPRASTGLGRNDVTPVAPPPVQTEPSAEDLNTLSDAEITALMGGIRRLRIQGRRSN